VRVDGELLERDSSLMLSDGYSLDIARSEVTLRWPSGDELVVRGTRALAIDLKLDASRVGKVRGMLGNFNGDPSYDLSSRDGFQFDMPISFEDTYGAFGESWRINQSESLFHYEAGEDTATFTGPNPEGPARVSDLPEAERTQAEATCRDGGVESPDELASCILDTVCSSSSDHVKSAAEAAPSASATAPGEHDVVTRGDVQRIEPPPTLADQPEMQAECSGPPERFVDFFKEVEGSTLAADLDVLDPTDPAASTTLPAGTRVNSYLLHSRPTSDSIFLSGSARFAGRIVGVIVDGPALDASDGSLGHPSTTYPTSEPRGIDTPDLVSVSRDGREIFVELGGSDVDQIRVLTEVL
jgi:hypothetical protein